MPVHYPCFFFFKQRFMGTSVMSNDTVQIVGKNMEKQQ